MGNQFTIFNYGWIYCVLTEWRTFGLGFLYIPETREGKKQFGILFLIWSLILVWDIHIVISDDSEELVTVDG